MISYWRIILRIFLICCIIHSFLTNSAFSQNLIKNPGFETGNISPPWNIWTGNEISTITIDTNNVYSGNFCAKLTGTEVYLFQSFNFEANTTYQICATIKTESGDTTYLGANDFGGDPVSLVFKDTIYRTDSLSFTTNGDPGNNPKIYIWKPDGSGSIWVDDIIMTADTTGRIPDGPGGLGIYYVSPLGNDINKGTSPEEAWQTIDKVNHINFEPGDKILFEGGYIFSGNIRFDYNDSGNALNNVYLGSYGTGRATIDAQTRSGFNASDCNFLNIKNINFKGDGRKTGNAGNGLFFSFCAHVTLDSIDVSGFQHSGVRVSNVGNNYRFTNIYSHDNGFAGIYFSGIDKVSLSDIYIGHCMADNNPGDPTVLENHSGNGIFAYNASNILIEFCEASKNGWDMPRIGNGPGGIWVAEVDSAIIQHCISHNNKTSVGGKDGLGFDLDGGTTNSVIQYCLSYNNQGAGYGIYQYSGASNWKNNTIRFCISENDGNVSCKGSINFWNESSNKDKFQGFEFYNNVVYNANGPALSFIDHFNSDFNFRNNILVSKTNIVHNGINEEKFLGNCWYPLDNEFYLNTVNDFNLWAQANNQEILDGKIIGIYADPMLNNPGNSTIIDPVKLMDISDYKVNEGSIVIDAGLDLQSLFNIDPGIHDYFGNTIKQGLSFDMGIHEYIEPLQKQEISFTSGWNMFSLPNNPDTSDMKTIFQPVIDRGSLVKIQDELGNSLEDWGIFGGWQNNIGGVAPSEGYKVKLNVDDSMKVFGTRVKYPFAIPLQTGWNIAGYPQQNSYSGMNIVQQLIDKGVLEKVQDEGGNSIEDWGIFGGWQNNIGDFVAGNGYKIKVNKNDTLWIYRSYPKSSFNLPELVANTHFRPAFEGNGVDHMNINLVDLPANVLQAGDELAIFDGQTCVGAITIMPHHLQSQTVSISASAADNQGMAGFKEGNPITMKLWNSKNNQEFKLEPEIIEGTLTFEKHETNFASLEKYASIGLEEFAGSDYPEIKCYPNPFSDEITVEINLKNDAEVEVEVLNQLGQKVKYITPKQMLNSGLHKLKWDGRNSYNQKVSSAIYHLRIIIDYNEIYRKIVFSH